MHTQHRCPKCDHGEVLYVPQPMDANNDPLAIGGGEIGWSLRKTLGGLESFTCIGCGYTELYVRDVRALDVSQIRDARVLTAKPPDVPYR